MNRYTITRPSAPETTVDADDFTTGDGVLIFRDEIGRGVLVVALEDGLTVDVEYDDTDPIFLARVKLAAKHREETLTQLRAAIDAPPTSPNRATRRSR